MSGRNKTNPILVVLLMAFMLGVYFLVDWITTSPIFGGRVDATEIPPTITETVVTATPVPTATAEPALTPKVEPTATMEVVTATPVPTATPEVVITATPVPTATPEATIAFVVITATPVPTATLVPTATPSPIPTVIVTEVPTMTPVPTATPTPEPTPIPTSTPTLTPTPTLEPTRSPAEIGEINFNTLKTELNKGRVGNDLVFSRNEQKKYDLYNVVSLENINDAALFEYLKEYFTNAIAPWINFRPTDGSDRLDVLTQTLASSVSDSDG